MITTRLLVVNSRGIPRRSKLRASLPYPHAGAHTMILRTILRIFGLGSALLLAWACMPAPVRGEGLTAIASFNGTNGRFPAAGVTFDANGNLYGTANTGGAN